MENRNNSLLNKLHHL